MKEQSLKKIIQKYSGLLAQATYEGVELSVQVEELNKELSEIHSVLNSDEGLKALFDEQKNKLGGL